MSNLGETQYPFKFTSKLRLLWCGLPHNCKQVGLHARPEVVVPGGIGAALARIFYRSVTFMRPGTWAPSHALT